MRALTIRNHTALALLGFFGLAVLLSVSLKAQVIEADKRVPAIATSSFSKGSLSTKSLGLEIVAVEAQLAKIQTDTEIEGVIKDLVREKYKKALDLLKAAQKNVATASTFQAAFKLAPIKTRSLQSELDTTPAIDPQSEIYKIANILDRGKEVKIRRTELSALESELSTIVAELAQTKSRPPEIVIRLLKVNEDLSDTQAQIAKFDSVDTSSPVRSADRVLLKAQEHALTGELEMLTKERTSQAVRVDHLSARRELLERQVKNAQVSLNILEVSANEGEMLEAEGLASQVKKLGETLSDADADTRALLTETHGLARDLIATLQLLEKTAATKDEISIKLNGLSADFEGFQSRVKLGYLEGSYADILIENRRRLPNPHTFAPLLREGQRTLQEMRYASYQVDMKLRGKGSAKINAPAKASEEIIALQTVHQELLGRLQKNYKTLVRELSQLAAEQRAHRDKITEVLAYLQETLFWEKSSPPIRIGEAVNVLATFQWLNDGKHLRESGRGLKWVVTAYPYLSGLLILLVILLLAARSRIIAKITKRGKLIRHISTDRFSHTVLTLMDTILLALPIPLVIGFIAWGIIRDPEGSDWLRGMGEGLKWACFIMAGAWFLGAVCRQGGLGIVHFGWNEKSAKKLRRALYLLVLGYVPAVLVMSSMLFEDSSRDFDTVGRFFFNVANVWAVIIFWKSFHPGHGIFTEIMQAYPKRLLPRFCWLWFSLLLAVPLGLIFLACLGYLFTAMALSLEFLVMLALIVAGTILYHLLLRWFIIKERKLALEEAIETRRKRREAASHPEEQVDEAVSIDAEEAELDLAKIGLQTRRLLRSIFTLGVIIVIGMVWSRTMPLDQILGKITIGGGLNLFEFIQVILILVCFAIVVINLPGLLELMGLRKAVNQPGTRYAIIKISQYILVSLGFVLLFDILDLDWSKFAWIITALSVGLGFGLQEIVANLVCGIILLFERPIRIGDVVTINEVTGTVTRIRMRATTITNWDRKEFIVPNKQFVTGTLLNWTLSNSIVRLFISVGVAYGSDTEKARQILLDVCRENSLVLEEPPPQATFEEFGESSLTMNLRCYIHGLENRVATISELHTGIDRLFKQAGIEIAFPQLDLHVKEGDSITKKGSGK